MDFQKCTKNIIRILPEPNMVSSLITLNLRNLSSGSYTLMLLSKDGQLIESQNIQIAK